MKRFFKRIFELNNNKRFWALIIIIVSAVLAIALGSRFYIANNINRSIEYGGGVNTLVQVRDSRTNEVADDALATQVSDSLFDRLTGGAGVNGSTVSFESNGRISITRNGITTDEEKASFETFVVNKPNLILTDVNGNPLFRNGVFDSNIRLNYQRPQDIDFNAYVAPLLPNSAVARLSQNSGSSVVELALLNLQAQREWTLATSYISGLRNGANRLIMWLDLKGFVDTANEQIHASEWTQANFNPYNFAFVNNRPFDVSVDPNTNQPMSRPNALKANNINSRNFLVSQAQVQQPLNGERFIIQGNFTNEEAQQLALDVNFGVAPYEIELLSSVFVSATLGNNAFNNALLAGSIGFALISLFMIFNYGILGLITTVSVGLYVFLTLLVFSLLRGEYSPATIAALVVGIGMSVDTNIITFERLKNQIRRGDTIKKAHKVANKNSLSTIVDANITTLIVATILFFFGTRSIRGFSITLFLSVIFTLVVMLVFSRVLATLLVGLGIFEDRLYLLGATKKAMSIEPKTRKYYNFNYMKNAKWFIIGSVAFFLIGVIVFGSFAGIGGSFGSGFVRSIEFQGGTNIVYSPTSNSGSFYTLVEATNVQDTLISSGLINNAQDVISIAPQNTANTEFVVVLNTTQTFSDSQLNVLRNIVVPNVSRISTEVTFVTSREAQQLVFNAILAVGIATLGVVIYTLVRLNWTFSISAVIALIHDILFVIAFFAITRLQVSPIFIAAMLSIIGYSINDTIVIFSRIREILHTEYFHQKYDYLTITKIANQAVAQTLKRSVLTTLTTMLTIIVLLAFNNATELSFNIAMLAGLTAGAYSSIFIASYLWTLLENVRQKGIRKRKVTNFWSSGKAEEQSFAGINDFNY